MRYFSPSAINPARVQALRAQWHVNADQRIVLLAGRLTAWKGQKILIEAAHNLTQNGLSNTVFILAGDDQGRSHYSAEIDAAIADYKLQSCVRRVGHCTDMAAAYMAAAVVTVPSTLPEAFGRSAVEAQAMGVPVIVTDLGAVPETVLAPQAVTDDARTGWHIPANNSSALARAIGAALGLSAGARADLAQRARHHVEMHFSLEHMCHRTLQLYARLLAPQSGDEL
jgi:glycosyltransferase involved in cell wall biosynthesis